MTKTDIKQAVAPRQNGICPLSGALLPLNNPELIDTDRVVERFRGGKYTDDNTRIVTPRAHMERHGNLREREDWLDHLKSEMDDRRQTMKLLTKMQNQLLAYERYTDEPNASTIAFLQDQLHPVQDRLSAIDKHVAKHIRKSDDPLVRAAMGVPSVGPITVAGLTIYVDLEKAQSASALWSYVGLDKPSHGRYTKGETSGGNKTLRTMLWNMSASMMKNKACPYREVYDRTKGRLAISEQVTTTRNNQGHLLEKAWKDTMASHRHGAALRAVMKHFLADYWYVGRELRGLDTRPLYVEEQLGHSTIVRPAERGWNW